MKTLRTIAVLAVTVSACSGLGCAARNVDLSQVERPARSPKLSAFDVFVGSWNWQAEILNADEQSRHWSGTARWEWTLDKRCLRGTLVAKSQAQNYEASGFWSWHPVQRTYVWWMFNNWGYPQEGSATYDESAKRWTMNYRSIGLDGTRSYGRHVLTVVDSDTLEWSAVEWADPLRLIKKIEMQGTYKRQ